VSGGAHFGNGTGQPPGIGAVQHDDGTGLPKALGHCTAKTA
jgi:hypothetical protein